VDDDVPPVPDLGEPPPPTDNTARIYVIVPAGAELWFEGQRTSKKGSEREFYSPKLVPGKTYSYRVKARWKEGSRTVEQTTEIKVRANEVTTLRFPLPPD
jgi:uncharacterized protein (TIGR03000 family)